MKEATIKTIKNNKIIATIKADSMCGTCPSSSNCFIKDCSKKDVEITTKNYKSYKVGETINIKINAFSSFIALFFAYILPLIILLTTFYSLIYFNHSQTKCGVIAILSLIPYYFLLFLSKEKIANKIEVKINDN